MLHHFTMGIKSQNESIQIISFVSCYVCHLLRVGSQRSQKSVRPTGSPAAVVVDSVKRGYTSGEVCVRESGRIKSRVYDRNRSGVFRPNI